MCELLDFESGRGDSVCWPNRFSWHDVFLSNLYPLHLSEFFVATELPEGFALVFHSSNLQGDAMLSWQEMCEQQQFLPL